MPSKLCQLASKLHPKHSDHKMTRIQPGPSSYDSTSNPINDFPKAHTHQRSLCTGSESTVDLWTHTSTGHALAVKSIKPHLGYKHSLPNELHILSALPVHANIVRAWAFYKSAGQGGRDAILFEFFEHGDLFSIRALALSNPLNVGIGIFSEKCMWSIFTQLVSGLAFLHEGLGAPAGCDADFWKTVLHRDIKLENIFVKKLGAAPDWSSIEVKFGDFGLAAFWSEGMRERDKEMPRHLGTPDFWPPEMTWEDRRYGPEADVWAVGGVLHELAHGFPPIVDPRVTRREVWSKCVDEKARKKLLPKDWKCMGKDMQEWYWAVRTPRKVWPVNVEEQRQERDARRKRPCPRYGDRFNECLMMALKLEKEERASAGELQSKIEEEYAAYQYEELEAEMADLMEENNEGTNSEDEDSE
ncbi:kinase-like protein [Lophiostoma macrostomum CBS 122681]|uniref:non-specific serine/threonine protein kinase n=1 Tax=Lophiostoma macrostomum CBS 122681 TaxID=1314788 RepID=A0A6A6TK12_9PLEO|nr:kinase-like protein [Lophiostoma macrostomum CBS 122681]